MPDNDPVQEKPPESAVLRVAVLSLVLNIALVAVKLALSLVSGSLTLRADAIHSLVDVFASAALILGLQISERKSEEFPYGLYKVENVVSVAIALLLFLTVYEIIAEAVTGEVAAVAYSGWVMVAVAALIPVPYLFGAYQERVGRRFNSPSIIADGIQHKADVLSSSIVFFAMLGQYLAFPLDRIGAVVISLFILRSGWEILKAGMRVLLDASIDYETLEVIRSIILAEPVVTEVRGVTGRNSGRYIFVEADVVLRLSDLERAHLVSGRIEDTIRTQVPNVDRVIIHYEPWQKTKIRYAVPLAEPRGSISPHFGEAPYFALIEIDLIAKRIERQEIVENRYAGTERGKGIRVAEELLSSKVDAVITREDLTGKGPGYAFSNSGVLMEMTDATMLTDLIDELLLRLYEE
jgi:cation diffusion facilitator family transporter